MAELKEEEKSETKMGFSETIEKIPVSCRKDP
jgi:hypothetical protein